ANLDQYDETTKICLDFDLGCLINGVELSAVLYKRGYKQLYLASGYKTVLSEIPSYLHVLSDKMALLNL
ncbi:MAG: hypothetical protein ACK4PR_14090, partial [Gammaproteobacteria bacterium]